jgi:hypothetical protein
VTLMFDHSLVMHDLADQSFNRVCERTREEADVRFFQQLLYHRMHC